jgi:hypothetical protein
MDERLIDQFSRRLVLGSVGATWLATLLGWETAFAGKRSPGKRCREKKRDFCAGRCCPKSQRCLNKACFASCDSPFQCPPIGSTGACGPEGECFCAKTAQGKSVCVDVPFPTNCNDLTVCDADTPCPAGEICFTCFCDMGATPNFRCGLPCNAGAERVTRGHRILA